MEEKKNYIEISLSDFWEVLKRCWILMLCVLILVSGGLFVYQTATHVDAYTSTVSLYILRTEDRTGTTYQDTVFADSIVSDCQKLLFSRDKVLEPAVQKLVGDKQLTDAEMEEQIAALKSCISVGTAGSESHIIYVSATTGNAKGSANVANAIALCATEYFNDLYGQKVASVAEAAREPSRISNGISKVKLGLLGIAAAMVVYLVFLVVYIVDDRIESEESVEKKLGISVLGVIPCFENEKKNKNAYYANKYGSANPSKEEKKK